jgi:hypothetical protein
MSDTTLWLDAVPRDGDAGHERLVPGRPAEVVHYPGARRDGGSDGRHGRTVSEPVPW